jgi:hypothetical protein
MCVNRWFPIGTLFFFLTRRESFVFTDWPVTLATTLKAVRSRLENHALIGQVGANYTDNHS